MKTEQEIASETSGKIDHHLGAGLVDNAVTAFVLEAIQTATKEKDEEIEALNRDLAAVGNVVKGCDRCTKRFQLACMKAFVLDDSLDDITSSSSALSSSPTQQD